MSIPRISLLLINQYRVQHQLFEAHNADACYIYIPASLANTDKMPKC